MESYLRHGEGVGEYTRVHEVLKLSYDALPYYLRPFFIYLACFPDSHKIDTEQLYLLWMAEDFISYQDKGPNESLRDVAQRYLIELVMRSMVQLHEATETYTSRNKFDWCGLHDSMRDLCFLKAEEENFLKPIDASRYMCGRRLAIPSSIGNFIRRLAISYEYGSVSGIDRLDELKDLRSFMLLGTGSAGPGQIGFKEGSINFEMSQCLRIFVVEGCEFEGEKLPSKVGELIHLRYLSLRLSKLRELPKSVCNIPYLQTLDLRVSSGIVLRLPNVIWKMKRLKHLFLNRGIEVIGGGEKLRLDGLKELETLKVITGDRCCIADIPKLVSLQSINVIVSDVDSMSIVLSNKRSQREIGLWVMSCDISSDKDMEVLHDGLMSPSLVDLEMYKCNMGGSFPHYKQGMCQNLVTLKLNECKVKVDVVEFGAYPMLRTLFLDGVEMTETLICHAKSFPQLKKLHLCNLSDLKKWELEYGAMPKLDYLSIHGCRNLEELPLYLKYIITLRQITIGSMPVEFMEIVDEGEYAPYVNVLKE